MSAVALNRASKCVLVASTFLTAYALLAVVRLHAHHLHHGPHDFHHGGPHGHAEPGQPERPEMPIDITANQQQAVVDPATSGLARGEGHHHGPHHHGPHGAEHGPHGPHKRCPASMLAHLALFAGLTGMASGFKPKSRRVLCYIGLLFAFEIAAVLVVLGGEVRAVRWCQQSAMMVPVQVSIMQAQVNNVNVLIAEESVGKPVKNEVFARECTHRVIHVATVSTIILGVVIGAFVACASRLLRETRAFERQAAAAAQGVVIAQPEELVVACSVEGVSEEKMSLRAHGEAI